MKDYLLTSEAARLLNRTPDAVRAMERSGRLIAVRVGHVRLFPRREVERFATEREKRRKARDAQAGRQTRQPCSGTENENVRVAALAR